MKKAIISIAVIVVLLAAALPLAIASADSEQTLDHMVISPAEVTLQTNETQQFTAIGQDSANVTVADVDLTWAVIFGSGNITADGLFTANITAGINVVQVTGEKDGVTETAEAIVTVVVPTILDHVVISPETVTLPINGTQQFTALGEDSENVTVDDVNFFWEVISGSGNITDEGLFTANSTAGTSMVQVIGQKDDVIETAQATVTVVVPSVLDHVVISPKTVTLPINGTQQFTAVGRDSANVTVAGVDFTWAVISGSGSITTAGLFTANNTAGTSIVQVMGEKDNIYKVAQATVTIVVPGVLDHVVISPKHAEIEINETQQFTAVGMDSANVTIAGVDFTWAVISGGGSISASGLFTAANVTGSSVIKVTAVKDSIIKTAVATVKIKAPAPDDKDGCKKPRGWSHGNKNGWDGKDTPPGWSKGEKKGWNGGDTPPGLSKGGKTGQGGSDCSPGQGKGKMKGQDKD